MSKRPFDHIENKIREAAENSEPPFNEHAWEKMELLLDKDKRKRRFLIWWRWGLPLLLICLVTGAYFLNGTSQPGEKAKMAAASNTQAADKIDSTIQQKADRRITIQPETSTNAGSLPVLTSGVPADAVVLVSKGSSPVKNSLNSKRDLTKSNPVITKTQENGADVNATPTGSAHHTDKKKNKKQLTKGNLLVSTTVDYSTADFSTPGVIPAGSQQQESISSSNKIVSIKETNSSNTKADLPVPPPTAKINGIDSSRTDPQPVAKAVAKKDNKAPRSKFYVLAEGGAEILKTKMLSYGNSVVSGRYGVGIGYEISKKLSVQTGFYAGRKKYTGGPGDYHPKQGSYWSMVDLKSVDASCLVYDIPVTLRYNFSKPSAKVNWYGMVGVSSFIMKKEDYHYYYTYRNMPNMVHDKAYSYSGNKNLFSILTLSAGFERKLSTRTAIIVEPYLSLPLAGVGEGTVNLYSTGLQVGIKYHPKF